MTKIIDLRVPTSWDDVCIRQFEALQSIDKDDENADFEIVSVLCDIDQDIVESLPIKEFGSILSKLSFLSTSPQPHRPAKQLLIDDKVINVTLSAQEMCAAQFLDYKNILSKENVDRRTARLMAVFMIPDGKEYNKGYNTNEWIDFLNNNLSVVEVQSYTNFFMLTYKTFATVFLKYSIREMKKMKGLTQEERMKILTPLQQGLTIIQNGGFLE